jgi:hypothetical protein
MFASPAVEFANNTTIWLVVDPAAGGPQSDYALVTICRSKGCVVVRFFTFYLYMFYHARM